MEHDAEQIISTKQCGCKYRIDVTDLGAGKKYISGEFLTQPCQEHKPKAELDLSVILSNVQDLASDLLYYDRKEDEELPLGYIEQAIKSGLLTVDEMVKSFSDSLKEFLRE